MDNKQQFDKDQQDQIRTRKLLLFIAYGFFCLVVGAMITTPREIERIVEVEKPVEVVKTEIKEIEVTNQACLDLINIDDSIFNKIADYFSEQSEAYYSASSTGDILGFFETASVSSVKFAESIEEITPARVEAITECKNNQ